MKTHNPYWSPYLAGALTGLLIVLSVVLTGKYFGASTSYVRSIGLLEQLISPERISQMQYFIKTVPKVEWQFMFVTGILLGGFLGAITSGTFSWRAVPSMWSERFGPSSPKRAFGAFTGGVIALFGARLAGGCPSGHGISGSLQLANSGFISVLCFFVGGVLMARLLYGGK